MALAIIVDIEQIYDNVGINKLYKNMTEIGFPFHIAIVVANLLKNKKI